MDGGCGCEQVRYHINTPRPPVVYACHCTECQTQSGSAFALQMPVFEGLLSVIGELVSGERTQPSGAIGTIFSCSECLVRIYSKNNTRPGMVTVRAGTLDNSKHIVPKFHLWTLSKQAWVTIPDDTIVLAEQPASPADWMSLISASD